MFRKLDAMYENGVLRLLEPNLQECELVPRPWRGVFRTDIPKEPIFSHELDVRTSELPSWKPHVTINRRRIEDDE